MKIKPVLGILVLAAAGAAFGAANGRLPFLQDDYPRAREEAKQKELPIFVECRAPW